MLFEGPAAAFGCAFLKEGFEGIHDLARVLIGQMKEFTLNILLTVVILGQLSIIFSLIKMETLIHQDPILAIILLGLNIVILFQLLLKLHQQFFSGGKMDHLEITMIIGELIMLK